MTSSLSSLSIFLLSPSPQKTYVSSLSSAPKPRTHRKNHLRRKLPPKTQALEPIPLEIPHLSLPIQAEEEEEEEEEEPVRELTHESQSLDLLTNPNPSSLILDLSLRFAALLAVQTVLAVWIFGGGGGGGMKPEESTDFDTRVRVIEKEVGGDEEGKEVSDFERAVLEIREMAREAREREAREREEREIKEEKFLKGGLVREKDLSVGRLGLRNSFGFMRVDVTRRKNGIWEMAKEAKEREESEIEKERFLKGALGEEKGLEKDSSVGKLGQRKNLGFMRANVTRRKHVPKGFSGSKKVDGRDNGGIRQIRHKNPMRESPNLHVPRQAAVLSDLSEKSVDVDNSSVLPCGKSSYVGELDTSLRPIKRSENDHETSAVNHKSAEREFQIKQCFEEGKLPSSTESSNINGRSDSPAQKKEAMGNSVVNKQKGLMFDHRKKPWWLKLPFVLAILLRRVSDGGFPKGLYSLKMDSPSVQGGSASYTVVFQDQGDATNFCYLLESFFEELDGFSAEVVPLMISELEEGVSSSEQKVIVVRKGQLQLYAGQPLAEVETALRSLVE